MQDNNKKKKIIFILVFVFVIILLVLGYYLFTKNNQTTTKNPIYNLYQKFNPFNGSSTTSNPNDIINNGEGVVDPGTEQKKLIRLTDFSISGFTYFDEKKQIATETENTQNIKINPTPQFETIPSLRYVERSTGHIYQMNLSTGSTGKISNSTIPGVYEVLFNNDASYLIYRYVSQGERSITSFLANIGGKSEFLASDILAVSLSPKKDQFFSLVKTSLGVNGITRSFQTGASKQVFNSQFSEWIPQWINEKNIILTTKASYLVNGSVFLLDITNGTLTKILSGIPGVTTLSNSDGTKVLYNSSLATGPKMNLLNTKDNSSKDLGFYGLPEKCVWSKDNINIYCAISKTIEGTQLPDSWYQGITSFSDYFVKINTEWGTITKIAETESDSEVDAINLSTDTNEANIFFMNKKDGTLWKLVL